MQNEDATWCTNEKCTAKTKCWRWTGFFEGDEIDISMLRQHPGGDDCKHIIERLDHGQETPVHA
jgi:hypothetical protein